MGRDWKLDDYYDNWVEMRDREKELAKMGRDTLSEKAPGGWRLYYRYRNRGQA